jgi:hypothetical protein
LIDSTAVHRGKRRDYDDFHPGGGRDQRLNQVHAAVLAEEQVDEGKVKGTPLRGHQRIGCGAKRDGVMSVCFEAGAQRLANIQFVIDDKNVQ